MHVNRLGILLLGFGLLPLVGCGAGQAEVTGTVTLKNQPLEKGIVTFFPEKGEPVAAFVDNGTYSVPTIVYGNYRVAVTPQAETMATTTTKSGRTLKPGEVDPTAKAASGPKPPKRAIPDKYHSADTSGLTCQVDKSKVTYPITLD
jgi:hypothetical protein